MKKIVLLSTVAAVVAFASTAKAEINPISGNDLWFVSGHAEAGIYKNQYWNDGSAMQNTRDDLQFNQGVLQAGKKLDKAKTFDVGGQVDVMYGTDARLVQSRGLEHDAGHGQWVDGDMYTAISQAFLTAKYGNASIKFGKMLTPMGHNSIYSTERFFYSLPNGYYMLPATMTGAVVDYKFNNKWSAFAGWGSSTDETFNSRDNNMGIAGIVFNYCEKLTVKLTGLYEKADQYSPDNVHYTAANFEVNYKPNMKWDYTFEVTYTNEKDTLGGAKQRLYSYNNELLYNINAEWAVGGRFEYVHGYNNVTKDNIDGYSLVLGANYKPYNWLVVKPEVRYDRAGGERIFEHGRSGKKDQFSFGVSAVVKF